MLVIDVWSGVSYEDVWPVLFISSLQQLVLSACSPHRVNSMRVTTHHHHFFAFLMSNIFIDNVKLQFKFHFCLCQRECFDSLCLSFCIAVFKVIQSKVINKFTRQGKKSLESGPEFDLTMKLAIVLPFKNPTIVFKAYSVWASRSHYSSPEQFSLGPWHVQRAPKPGTMCSMFAAMGWGL